jgi:glycosyltransferase involved in cell wall biosynthesis
MPDLSRCVLFQHNVEAQIWRRHVEHARTPLHRAYFGLQYKRMEKYEGKVCRQVRRVVAVSDADAEAFRTRYGAADVRTVSTGVDIDYFRPSSNDPQIPAADLVFVGSMDWMPNIDGIRWFVAEVLPGIRRHRPAATLAIVGRKPVADIAALGRRDAQIRVTGTVPDVRPWLHGSTVSIVPLRVGGGTRLKIYEAMAARVPVVSTAVGAEGLDVRDGHHIRIADSPAAFAAACLELLGDADRRRAIERAAFDLVASKYSWDAVTAGFGHMIAV